VFSRALLVGNWPLCLAWASCRVSEVFMLECYWIVMVLRSEGSLASAGVFVEWP